MNYHNHLRLKLLSLLQQLSQFWYDNETIDKLTKGAINSTENTGKIALVSCPTLYKSIKKNCGDREGKFHKNKDQ